MALPGLITGAAMGVLPCIFWTLKPAEDAVRSRAISLFGGASLLLLLKLNLFRKSTAALAALVALGLMVCKASEAGESWIGTAGGSGSPRGGVWSD